jgi:ABC-type sugar transport system substrate-binding protein
MKLTKKTLAMMTAVAAIVSLSACSSGGGSSADKPLKITMVQGFTGSPYAQTTAAGAQDAADALGVDLTITGPVNIDPAKEVQIFEQVVGTNPDGILLHELPPDLFTRPVQIAEEAGIPILPYTIAPAADTTSKSYVGSNDRQVGRDAADYMADLFIKENNGDKNVKGTIVTGICVPGLSVLTSRVEGFTEQMNKRLPNVTVTEAFDSKTDPAENYAVWEQAAAANPDALEFFGPCEGDNQSLTKIKEATGAKWKIVSLDTNEIVLNGLKAGLVEAVFPTSSYAAGYVALWVLATALQNGEPMPEGWVDIPVVPIFQADADTAIAREASPAKIAEFWKPYIDEIVNAKPIKTQPLSDSLK